MTAPGIVEDVQVFVRKPDQQLLAWLEERRRMGLDRRDEVWNGVLHVVPPASFAHQRFESDLEAVLRRLAERQALLVVHEVGVFHRIGSATDYRVPDLVVLDPQHASARGIEARAEIVIEVLSPDDESRNKFGFYASCGIPEYWLVHPVTRAVEVYVLSHGAYAEQPAAADGTIEAPRLGLQLRVVDGPKLRLSWADGSAEI